VWSDPVSKVYEEQELSMSMALATEQELQKRKKEAQPEAMYATVRRSAKSVRDNIGAMDGTDGYATLGQQREAGFGQQSLHRNGTLGSNRSEYHEMYPTPSNPMDYHRIRSDNLPPPPPPTVSEVHPGAHYPHDDFSPFATTEIL